MKKVLLFLVITMSLPFNAHAQMKLVKDILPGLESSIYRVFNEEPLEDKLIFTANSPDQNYRNFWVSDGTENGTFMIQENIDEEGSSLGEPLTLERLGDKVIFSTASPNNGIEPWITDGTLTGTMLLKDIATGKDHSLPRNFTRFGDEVYFYLATDGSIWKTDGTEEGTVLALDPADFGLNVFDVIDFEAVDDKLFFFSGTNQDLWVTDGTSQGTEIILERSNIFNRIITEMTAINGALYFTNQHDLDDEPWISDGTVEGTKMLKDIVSGRQGSDPEHYTEYNGEVYFSTNSGLWKTDGTEAGTVLVKGDIDLQPLFFNNPNTFQVFKGELYFTAEFELKGIELWKTDGTEAGTMMYDLLDGFGTGVEARFLTVLGDTMFFSGENDDFDRVLWRTNGTEAGTEIVPTNANPSPRSVSSLRVVGSKFFFTAYDDLHGDELWVYQSSDATPLSAAIVQTNDILCNGDETGALEVQVTGGIPPYTYSWDSPLASGQNPTGLPAGDYSVTVTDAEPSNVVLSYTITEPSAIITMTSSTPETGMMSNGSVNVNVSGGTPPYTYHWFTSPPASTAEVDSLSAGIYYLIVTDANGCRKGDSARVGTMVSTLNVTSTSEWTVYPIPSSDQLYIEFSEANDYQNAKIQLISADGAVLLEQATSGKKTVLEVSNFAPGIYFVKLLTEDGKSTRKVMIQTE